MPEKYLKVKKALMSRGQSKPEAERMAAAIYNSQRKPGQKPVGPGYEKRKK